MSTEEFTQNVIKYTIEFHDIIELYSRLVRRDVLQHINEGFIPTPNTPERELYDKLIQFDKDTKSIVGAMNDRWGERESPSMYKMLNISNMQFRNFNLANEYKRMIGNFAKISVAMFHSMVIAFFCHLHVRPSRGHTSDEFKFMKPDHHRSVS